MDSALTYKSSGGTGGPPPPFFKSQDQQFAKSKEGDRTNRGLS